MKQLKRTRVITYQWRREDDDIKPEHIPALEETAEERIAVMMGEGYTGGELDDNIHMTVADPEDGVEYRGWWEVQGDLPGGKTVESLWLEFGDIPVDGNECLEEPFLRFPVGTHREDVWHWFEEQFDVRVADLTWHRKEDGHAG